MKHLIVLILCVGASLGIGQETPRPLTKKVPVKVSSGAPVSRAEAKKTFLRADAVIRRSLRLGGNPTSAISSGSAPISRGEVVSELTRLYAIVRPKVTLTPRPVRYDAKRFKISATSQLALAHLVKLGAVAPFGPLATGPNDSLTVEEFGDALGFFLARMAEITYLPSRRWTPNLQDQ